MKDRVISVRLSENEFKQLEKHAAATKMSNSTYIRELIVGSTPKEDNSKQELARRFCELYRVISEQNLDDNDALMEEVESLCQILY